MKQLSDDNTLKSTNIISFDNNSVKISVTSSGRYAIKKEDVDLINIKITDTYHKPVNKTDQFLPQDLKNNVNKKIGNLL